MPVFGTGDVVVIRGQVADLVHQASGGIGQDADETADMKNGGPQRFECDVDSAVCGLDTAIQTLGHARPRLRAV